MALRMVRMHAGPSGAPVYMYSGASISKTRASSDHAFDSHEGSLSELSSAPSMTPVLSRHVSARLSRTISG